MTVPVEEIELCLWKIVRENPEVTGAVLNTLDGLPIAKAWQFGEEMRISAMSAGLMSTAEQLCKEITHDDFKQVFIRGNQGYLILIPTNNDYILAIETTEKFVLNEIFALQNQVVKKAFTNEEGSEDFESLDNFPSGRKISPRHLVYSLAGEIYDNTLAVDGIFATAMCNVLFNFALGMSVGTLEHFYIHGSDKSLLLMEWNSDLRVLKVLSNDFALPDFIHRLPPFFEEVA